MDRAMEEQGVTDATREKVRELMKDPEVVALYHLKKNSIGMCSNWKQIEYSFFEAVADVAGDPAVDVKEKLRKECEFLGDERCPAASSTLSRLFGGWQTSGRG
jgi:hypothetical protein